MKYCAVCNDKFDDSLSFCPTDGEVLEEDPSALIGSALDGQYQIESILGKGGMGAVYLARHILLGDRVAIKVLPPEMRGNTEWLRRFQREGQAARRFRHPNAVTVYDLRTSADGTIYLVMEYVEGVTLDAELKKHGRFSPAEALTVLDPVMSVLNAAHAMGVVHRDLKPENIMIGKASTDGEPVVKLLDLGIAKLREVAGAEKTGNTNLTIAGQMLGTPYYMSPEQWGELPRDGSSEIDGRADIYSLGIVCYEIVSGGRPFSGVTLSELRREHTSIVPKPLHEFVPNVPEGFSRGIAQAIAKDRGDRQATAGELANELKSSLNGAVSMPTVSAPGVAPGGVTTPIASNTQPRGFVTAAERTAPTIVGESALTEVEAGNAVSAPTSVGVNAQSQAGTIPTVIVSEQELAARAASAREAKRTAPDVREVAPVVPTRRLPFLFIGAGVIVLLLIVGVGAFAVIHFMNSGAANDSGKTGGSSGANGAGGAELPPTPHEVGRYWLELNIPNHDDAIRADKLIPLKSKQEFKFHFSPSESGYLYIIGPGPTNAPMTFLTAQPPAESGVKTNEVKSGIDFSFPADTAKNQNWITLNNTTGTDEFTIIFSPTELTEPAFLTAAAAHELTQNELKQLDDLRTRFKANSVSAEVIKTGALPAVSVKVPQTGDQATAVVFTLTIEHH
ncbi:MAG TPA: protein kinase [Pyrinomonadaceae bacterium]|nr:protein kinase [Pyrinomonadaceae bacterium]